MDANEYDSDSDTIILESPSKSDEHVQLLARNTNKQQFNTKRKTQSNLVLKDGKWIIGKQNNNNNYCEISNKLNHFVF